MVHDRGGFRLELLRRADPCSGDRTDRCWRTGHRHADVSVSHGRRALLNRGSGSSRSSAVNLSAPTALVYDVLTAHRDYAALYQEVGPALWRAIYAYSGGQRDVADDAVAEVFARAIQHDRAIRQPRSWLYRTAFRIAAAEVRRRKSQTEIGEHSCGAAPGPDRGASWRSGKLPPSQRAAIYLHYQVDLPVREVARLMGTSVATVKVHLHRGRKRLRGLLGTGGDERWLSGG